MKHFYPQNFTARVLLSLLFVCAPMWLWAQVFTQDGVNYFLEDENAYVDECTEATGDVSILNTITVDGVEYPVTRIADYAFYENANITSVVIPDNVQKIGGWSFCDCTNLVTVTIGSGMTYIGGDAFYRSRAITDVYITADPEALDWQDWGRDDFKQDGTTVCHVADANVWREMFYYVNISFRDPNTVLFNWTYDESTHTLYLNGNELIPNFGYSMPWSAYKNEITRVVIADGIPNLPDKIFYGHANLASVSIPSSVKRLGEYTFQHCESLTSISIPDGVELIPRYSFYGCKKLASVNFSPSSSLKEIEHYAFAYCPSLQSFTFPSGLGMIGYTMFYGCDNLTNIEVDSENPYYMSYEGAVYSKGNVGLFMCPSGKSTIDFHPDVTYINNDAFFCCSKFTSIDLPNTIETINDYAFENCTGLQSFHIPASVSFFEPTVFWGCTNLNYISVDKDNPSYKSIDGNVYTKDGLTFYRAALARTNIFIPDGVTAIGSVACQDCEKLTSITIPNSVTEVGAAAFNYCKNLKTVTIGSGVTKIYSDAFYSSKAVTDVFCYANPENLEWDDAGYDEFADGKTTVCHVFDADAFKAKWDTGDTSTDVRVTFQSDLLPQVTTADLGDADLTTYYNGVDNVKTDAGTTLFKVSFNGSQVTSTTIADHVIPAGQGVMLKSDSKLIAMATTTETSEADYSDNALEGVDVATSKAAGYKYYTLGLSNSELGFYEFTGSTLEAHKAFIKTASGPASGYKFDNPTDLNDLKDFNELNDVIYNIAGQRLSRIQKGFNIINGRKTLIK